MVHSYLQDLAEQIKHIQKWNTYKVTENLKILLVKYEKICKKMLQQNEDEEKIMKYTNAKKEDIEAAKKELGMN